jgi:nucleoside-diphosphate-sugar epimerase
LITGGAGFIGGHTVLALIDRGEIPIVLDDLSTGLSAESNDEAAQDRDQEEAQKKPQPCVDAAEVIADGGEDSVAVSPA